MNKKVSFIPPIALAKEAELGLKLRKEFGRGGTMVGVARARDLKNRRPLSARTIKRMYSFFARHYVDKQGKNFHNELKPSNGKIAWLLWGGDPGASWAHKKYLEIFKNKRNPSV
jgi:hypothetical protein